MARRKILMLRSPRQRASRSTHNHAPPAASAADAGNELLTGHRRHHQFQGLDHLAIVSSLVLREDIEDRFRRQAASVGAGLEAGAEHVAGAEDAPGQRSEEHTSELQSLMLNSYAVFCLKKKK